MPLTYEIAADNIRVERPWLLGFFPLGNINLLRDNVIHSNFRISGLAGFGHILPISPYASYYDIVGMNLSEYLINMTYGLIVNEINSEDIHALLLEAMDVFLEELGIKFISREDINENLLGFIRLFQKEWLMEELIAYKGSLGQLHQLGDRMARKVSEHSHYASQFTGEYKRIYPKPEATLKPFNPGPLIWTPDQQKIYAADSSNDQIHIFEASGTYVKSFGSPGENDGQLKGISSLAFSPDGNQLFVADLFGKRVQIFDGQGQFQQSIKFQNDPSDLPQFFLFPEVGRIYLASSLEKNIRIFDLAGKPLGVIQGQTGAAHSLTLDFDKKYLYAIEEGRVRIFDLDGKEMDSIQLFSRLKDPLERLRSPYFSPDGQRMYVIQNKKRRVDIFEKDDNLRFTRQIKSFPLEGVPPEGLLHILFEPKDGHVMVLYNNHQINNRFFVYDRDGNHITSFGNSGLEKGQFYNIKGAQMDPSGRLLVANFGRDDKAGWIDIITPAESLLGNLMDLAMTQSNRGKDQVKHLDHRDDLSPLFKAWTKGIAAQDELIFEARQLGFEGWSMRDKIQKPLRGNQGLLEEPPVADYLPVFGFNSAVHNLRAHGKNGVFLWRESPVGYEVLVLDYGKGAIDPLGKPVDTLNSIFNWEVSFRGRTAISGEGKGMNTLAKSTYLTRFVSMNNGHVRVVTKKEPGFKRSLDYTIPAKQENFTFDELEIPNRQMTGGGFHAFVPIDRDNYKAGRFGRGNVLSTIESGSVKPVIRGSWQERHFTNIKTLKEGKKVLLTHFDYYEGAETVTVKDRVRTLPDKAGYWRFDTMSSGMINANFIRKIKVGDQEVSINQSEEILEAIQILDIRYGSEVEFTYEKNIIVDEKKVVSGILKEKPSVQNQGVYVVQLDGGKKLEVSMTRVKQVKQVDRAMRSAIGEELKFDRQEVGGIDLNPNMMDLEAQGDTIKMNFPDEMDPAMMQDIEGLYPVILHMAPVTNLPFLLGMTAEDVPRNPDDESENKIGYFTEPRKLKFKM